MGPKPICIQIIALAQDFGYTLTTTIPTDQKCCEDPGLVCDSNGGKIYEIHWTPTVTKLSGNFNTASWANFPDLTVVEMSDQNLSGTIPTFISSNTKLTILQIQGNQITGGISSFPTKLILGDYSNNLMTGSIPASIPTSLRTLNINNNLLTGGLPSNLGGLTTLNVGNNLLSGSIPSNLGSLILFDVSHNQLSGVIPSFPIALVTFIANNNTLTGSLPAFFNVRTLDVSFNSLMGVVPAVPAGFVLLKLQNNQFTSVGTLGTALTTNTCDVSNNPLYSWTAPSWVGKCSMNNLLTTTNVKTTTTTKTPTLATTTKAVSTLDITTQVIKTSSINQRVTATSAILKTVPLSFWSTLEDVSKTTSPTLIDSIMVLPNSLSIDTINPRTLDLSYSDTFTNSNTWEQPMTTQIITTVYVSDASILSPIALIVIIFLLTIIIAGCSIEICIRQTKSKSGDARSFFSRNTRQDIRDAWKSFIPVPSRRNSKTTTIATRMSEKAVFKRQAREIN